jgi:hypothetical protein
LVSCNILLGQEQQIYSAGKVHQLPIFPDCEKVSEDRSKLLSCISRELSIRVHKNLVDFDEVMNQSGFEKAEATLQFLVSKEGVLIDIRPLQGGNPILGDAAAIALEKIAMELPPIQPAKLKNGTPVNVVFQLPIEYRVKKEEVKKVENEYPVDEIVLFTLIPDGKPYRYEVRLYKNRSITIYEKQDSEYYFLGKYLTLNELERSEPYKSLMEKERKLGKTLVTDGFIGEEFYEVYIHNLFGTNTKSPVFVEVYKKVKGKNQSVAKFEKEESFNQSIYAPLIYRD